MPAKEVILIVEDSAPNATILGHLITHFGFETVIAKNGLDALTLIESMDKDCKLIGVFSDIMMPVMDGLQLLEKLRSHPIYKDIFFVLVTAVFEKDYIIKARDLKVNGYLLKPVTHEKINKMLSALTRFQVGNAS